MLRHVFQYDKMDTPPGLFLGDPSSLPPLRASPEQLEGGQFERPRTADEAGLSWTDDRPYDGSTRNTGTIDDDGDCVDCCDDSAVFSDISSVLYG